MLFAGQIGSQRHYCRRNCPCALNDTAENHPVNIGGGCGNETADGEQDQTKIDHRLAPDTVGQPAEWDLQYRLGQPVGAKCDTDQQVVVAAGQILGIEREYRQNDEHSKHAQPINTGQAGSGAQFNWGHLFVG